MKSPALRTAGNIAAQRQKSIRSAKGDSVTDINHFRAEVEKLRAEVEKLRAALEPFADMGKAMMGRKHHNEAVVQYDLAPTIKVFHLVRAHETRSAITQETT